MMKYCLLFVSGILSAASLTALGAPSGDEALLLHLRFDEALANDSAKGRAGIATIGATPGAGEYAGALYFDGFDDHVRVPDFDYGPHFTVSFWFNTTENEGGLYQYMFSHGNVHVRTSVNAYFVEDGHHDKRAAGRIKTTLIDTNDRDTSPLYLTQPGLADGNWHHYVVTAHQDGMSVFINGVLVNTWPHGGDPINPRGDIVIGRRSDMDLERSYKGYLDEIRLYNRPLDPGEVKELFSKGR